MHIKLDHIFRLNNFANNNWNLITSFMQNCSYKKSNATFSSLLSLTVKEIAT